MAIQLNLSQELEAKLRQRATDLGVTLEGLATELLSAGVAPSAPPLSGSQLVELWKSQGLIGYRKDITDPVKHSTAVRRSIEHRSL